MEQEQEKKCEYKYCENVFSVNNLKKKYCSSNCRTKAWILRETGEKPTLRNGMGLAIEPYQKKEAKKQLKKVIKSNVNAVDSAFNQLTQLNEEQQQELKEKIEHAGKTNYFAHFFTATAGSFMGNELTKLGERFTGNQRLSKSEFRKELAAFEQRMKHTIRGLLIEQYNNLIKASKNRPLTPNPRRFGPWV